MRIELNFGGDAGDAGRATEQIIAFLERLSKQAEMTDRHLQGMKVDQTAVVAGLEAITQALNRLQGQALATNQRLKAIELSSTQTAQVVANAKIMERSVDDIGDAADRSKRKMASMAATGGLLGALGMGENDNRLQAGDLVRGVLPGGRRSSVGAVMMLGATGLAAGGAAGPGLLGLLAAIPALASAAGASIGVLAVGLGGLGDAIDGDAEAFSKLTPRTQEFVQEVRGFIPFLKEIQERTREGLFPGLTEGMNAAMSGPMAAMLRESSGRLGGAVGGAAADFGRFLGSGGTVENIGQIARDTEGHIDALTDATISWTDSLLDLGAASGPFVEWLLRTNADLAQSANEWLSAKIASGEFADAMDDAKRSLELVADLVSALVNAVVELGQALGPAGALILEGLTDALNELADTVEANDEQITDFAVGAVNALRSAVEAAWPLVKTLADNLDAVAEAIGGWETAFQLILGGILLRKVKELTAGFTGLAGAEAAAGGAGAVGILGATGAATRLEAVLIRLRQIGPIAIAISLLMSAEDRAKLGEIVKVGLGIDDYKDSGDALKIGERRVNKNGDTVEWRGSIGDGGQGWVVVRRKGEGPAPRYSGPATSSATGRGPVIPAIGRRDDHGGGLLSAFTGHGVPREAVAAEDYMRPVGTALVAPENGTLTRTGGRPGSGTPGGPGGLSLYFVGDETGTAYYMTHLMWVAKPGRYAKGALIGRIGPHASGSHAHVEQSKHPNAVRWAGGAGSATVSGETAQSRRARGAFDPSPAGGQPPPFEPETGAYQLPVNIRTMIARAGTTPGEGDDIRAYRAAIAKIKADIPKLSGEMLIAALEMQSQIQSRLESALKTNQGSRASKSSIMSLILGIDRIQEDLKEFPTIAAKYGAELQKIENRLRQALDPKRAITADQLAELRDRFNRRLDVIREAMRKEEERIREAQAKQRELWREMARAMLEEFDAATRAWRSPAEMLLDQMTSARDEMMLERSIRDAEERVADARKRLDEALKGRRPDSDPILDQVRDIVGRYSQARAIDAAQSTLLGIAPGNFGGIIDELQGVLQQTLTAVVDPEAVEDAQRALRDAEESLEDARYQRTIAHLRRKAEAEREAFEKERAQQRQALETTLDVWEAFWVQWHEVLVRMGITMDLFVQSILAQQDALGAVGAATGQSSAEVAAAIVAGGGDPALAIPGTENAGPQRPGGHRFAAGGTVFRPHLLVDARTGSLTGTMAEFGPERIVPTGGDGGSPTIVIEADEEGFARFLRAKVVQSTSALSVEQGTRASRLRREGRL